MALRPLRTSPQGAHTRQPSTAVQTHRHGITHPLLWAPSQVRLQAAPSPATSSISGSSTSIRIAGINAQGLYGAPPGPLERNEPLGYWDLLNNPEQDSTIFGNRARSATDANVLRRKGHLKEQDHLIEYMRMMHETHTCEEVMLKMERWITEHRQDPKRSRLKRLVPQIGNFFATLKLVDAFREYDAVFALSRRKYIPPNFAELRHIVNIAQVHASAENLKLITFDADGTLYADGAHFDQDNAMISHIINLMKANVQVAIVTAAGYPGEADKFERRLSGLLDAFRRMQLPGEITNRFHIMGGECNYLLRVRPDDKRLEFVPDEKWKLPSMLEWREEDIQQMLDEAHGILVESAKRLNLQVQVIRKPRSVGIVPLSPTIYEVGRQGVVVGGGSGQQQQQQSRQQQQGSSRGVRAGGRGSLRQAYLQQGARVYQSFCYEVLEDIALTCQMQLVSKVPLCAFNGGNDVFVDVGNKSLGLQSLMRYFGTTQHETLHVGDRFTLSGNDTATRDVCSVLWVANPEETGFFIKVLLKDIRKTRYQPYIE